MDKPRLDFPGVKTAFVVAGLRASQVRDALLYSLMLCLAGFVLTVAPVPAAANNAAAGGLQHPLPDCGGPPQFVGKASTKESGKLPGLQADDETPPQLLDLQVSEGLWIIDGVNTYNILFNVLDEGVGLTSAEILINGQGDNCSQRRGLYAWRATQDATPWLPEEAADRIACGGVGGYAERYIGAEGDTGHQHGQVVSCYTKALADGSALIRMTLLPATNFGEFAANDVSLWAQDLSGNATNWVNYDTNFATEIIETEPPTQEFCGVSEDIWAIDGHSTRGITLVAEDNGSGVSAVQSIINLQGDNDSNRRGLFAWSSSGYTWEGSDSTDRILCSGGGYAEKYNGTQGQPEGFGKDYIELTGCSTTVDKGQREVTFTVRPAETFGEFLNNDVSFWAKDAEGNATGWINHDLNFESRQAVPYDVSIDGVFGGFPAEIRPLFLPATEEFTLRVSNLGNETLVIPCPFGVDFVEALPLPGVSSTLERSCTFDYEVPPGADETWRYTVDMDFTAQSGLYGVDFLLSPINGDGTTHAFDMDIQVPGDAPELTEILVRADGTQLLSDGQTYTVTDSLVSGDALVFGIKNGNEEDIYVNGLSVSVISEPDGANLDLDVFNNEDCLVFISDRCAIAGTLTIPGGDELPFDGVFLFDGEPEGDYSIQVSFDVYGSADGSDYLGAFVFNIAGTLGCSEEGLAVCPQQPPLSCSNSSAFIKDAKGRSKITLYTDGVNNNATVLAALDDAMANWANDCPTGQYPNIPTFERKTGSRPQGADIEANVNVFYVLGQSPNGPESGIHIIESENGVHKIILYEKDRNGVDVDYSTRHGLDVVTHELGHALGLDHDQCVTANFQSIMKTPLDRTDQGQIFNAHCELANAVNCNNGSCPNPVGGYLLSAKLAGYQSGTINLRLDVDPDGSGPLTNITTQTLSLMQDSNEALFLDSNDAAVQAFENGTYSTVAAQTNYPSDCLLYNLYEGTVVDSGRILMVNCGAQYSVSGSIEGLEPGDVATFEYYHIPLNERFDGRGKVSNTVAYSGPSTPFSLQDMQGSLALFPDQTIFGLEAKVTVAGANPKECNKDVSLPYGQIAGSNFSGFDTVCELVNGGGGGPNITDFSLTGPDGDISNGGSFSFATVAISDLPVKYTFTLANDSDSDMAVADFSVNDPVFQVLNEPDMIPANATDTFEVRLKATAEVGAHSGTLSFEVLDESFTVELDAEVIADNLPSDIDVGQGALLSPKFNEGQTYFFGEIELGESLDKVIGIKNVGGSDLTLTDELNIINRTGNAFTLVSTYADGTVLTPGQVNTETVIRLQESVSAGDKSVEVWIASDDPDQLLYKFTFDATVHEPPPPPAPLIVVSVAHEGLLDFGALTPEDLPLNKTVTITNNGDLTLNLDDYVIKDDLFDDFEFIGTPPTSVAANSNKTFQVRLKLGATGLLNARVEFTHDADNADNPYWFSLGAFVQPEVPGD